jgi:hypothetical protein
VREVTTIGWDIANASGRNTHFYDTAAGDDFFDRERGTGHAMARSRRHLPEPVRLGARWARAFIAHRRGSLYNRAVPVPGETELVAESTADANDWLAAEGVALRVVSPSPYLAPGIERLDTAQLFDELER